MSRTKNGADAFYECVGRPETANQAIEYTAPGGSVLMIGNPAGDMEFHKSIYWKILRNELKRLGYDCPKDIGVMGFNNLAISTHINPSLTTVDIPMVDIGQKTVDRLINIMNKDKDNYKISFQTKLIIRESTRRVK